jgi:endonuclease/exonuclease/phosphatase family metal-dependent hydrolase
MKLKLMTYNIASCRTYKLGPDYRPVVRDFDPYIKALQGFAPDVCGLNEVDYKHPRSCRVKMAQMLGDALGYDSAFAPAVTWGLGTYGNGFISKYKIKEIESYPIPDPAVKDEPAYYESRVVLHAVVDMGGRDVDFFVTHFGLARAEAQNAADTLVWLIKTAKNPVVVMGDFNPEDYINGERLSKTLFYKEELARFAEAGLEPANAGRFGAFDTIIHDSFNAISPCPFDNILVTPNIEITAADRHVEPWMNDHALVWANLTIK